MNYSEIKNNHDFELIDTVSHDDVRSFVSEELSHQSIWARVANMYQITGLLAFILGGFKAFMPYFVNRELIYLKALFIGILFTFSLLIVLHETIHALAYLVNGYNNLSFNFKPKKFLFYVQADQQVVDVGKFKIIALAPVVSVAVLSMLGMAYFYDQATFYFFIPIFAFHSFFCAGDFGLLSYFSNRHDKEIYSVDVKSDKKTYFYNRIKK